MRFQIVAIVVILYQVNVCEGFRRQSLHGKRVAQTKLQSFSFSFPVWDHFQSLLRNVHLGEVIEQASTKALNGGVAGASAAAVQVLSLMWLRTTVNYQYRFGTTTLEALQTLYKEGGVARLYQGLPLAIIQGPLSRFGDTAANALVLTLWSTADQSWAHDVPLWIQTGSGSLAAGLWRIFLMPIDTYKTTLQVHGPAGWSMVNTNVKRDGLSVLYNGALAASAATVVGHFPWFLTYNFLSSHLPSVDDISQLTGASADVKGLLDLSRTAFIGLCASSLSDTSSNALRVLKTTKQTQPDRSYLQAAQIIIAEDGVLGLFGRGLQTKIASNAIQGVLFSVLYKYFLEHSVFS